MQLTCVFTHEILYLKVNTLRQTTQSEGNIDRNFPVVAEVVAETTTATMTIVLERANGPLTLNEMTQ